MKTGGITSETLPATGENMHTEDITNELGGLMSVRNESSENGDDKQVF